MENVFYYESIDSTNAAALNLARAGFIRGAVIAKEQTAGRGRLGRSFSSPAGGLYLSYVFALPYMDRRIYAVPPAASLAVHSAIQEVFGLRADIKYPNDLLLEGRKICGILCESAAPLSGTAGSPERIGGSPGESEGPEGKTVREDKARIACHAVVGIGVNVCSEVSDAGTRDYPAASIKDFAKAGPEDIIRLAEALLPRLDRLASAFARGNGFPAEEEAAYRVLCINCPETIVKIP